MAESEKQLELKKRARRRLVGAAAFALTAAIILPMVMDHEPRPLTQDIQIRIPNPDGTASRNTSKAADAAPKAESRVETRAEPKPEVALPATAGKALEEARPAAAPADVAKPVPAADPKKDAGAPKPPPKAEREARVEAILSGKENPAAGEFVVQLGAFSDPANVSKVRARVKESGFGSYTEMVKGAKGEQTRVRAGPFATREAAEQAAAKLKHAGLAGVVASR